jgi:hypothetical protein
MPNYSIYAENFQFELVLTKGINYPDWKIEPGFKVVSQIDTNNTQTIVIDVPVTKLDTSITLTNFGKTDQDTIMENGQIVRDQTLVINRVWANAILLEHYLIKDQSQTMPDYTQSNLDYAKEHNIELARVLQTDKLNYNGTWKFNFEQPFFEWYNYLLFEKLKIFNHWVAQSHLGIADENQIKKLKIFLDSIS